MRIQPKKILCAIDFSDFSNMVISYGDSLSQEFGSSLSICHIVTGSYMVSSHMTPYIDYANVEVDRVNNAKQSLKQFAHKLGSECELFVSAGHPADEIARLVEENDIDMVIAATHGGSGVKRFLVGSVTDRLTKILSCPLMVLHPKKETTESSLDTNGINLKRILVGCDFSSDSKLAFQYALSLAQEFQTQLYLAHVMKSVMPVEKTSSDYIKIQGGDYMGWDHLDYLDLQRNSTEDQAENRTKLLSHFEKKLFNMVPKENRQWCTPVTALLEGQPYQALLNYAEENQIDMIVLGVRGHSILEKFIVGTTTDRVISRASCPVLCVRQLENVQKNHEDKIAKEKGFSKSIQAKDIMETNVITITLDTDITSAVKLLMDNHINGVPVINSDEDLIGILCQSDLIYQQKEIPIPPIFSLFDGIIPLSSSKQYSDEIEKIAAIAIEKAMVKDPVTVNPETSITEIASLMVEKHFHTIPVVKNDKIVGIIGKEDILKVLIPRKET